jgi:hypothetical protein
MFASQDFRDHVVSGDLDALRRSLTQGGTYPVGDHEIKHAVMRGHLSILTFLMDELKIRPCDKALAYSLQQGRHDSVHFLLERNAPVDIDTIFHNLFKYPPDVEDHGYSDLPDVKCCLFLRVVLLFIRKYNHGKISQTVLSSILRIGANRDVLQFIFDNFELTPGYQWELPLLVLYGEPGWITKYFPGPISESALGNCLAHLQKHPEDRSLFIRMLEPLPFEQVPSSLFEEDMVDDLWVLHGKKPRLVGVSARKAQKCFWRLIDLHQYDPEEILYSALSLPELIPEVLKRFEVSPVITWDFLKSGPSKYGVLHGLRSTGNFMSPFTTDSFSGCLELARQISEPLRFEGDLDQIEKDEQEKWERSLDYPPNPSTLEVDKHYRLTIVNVALDWAPETPQLYYDLVVKTVSQENSCWKLQVEDVLVSKYTQLKSKYKVFLSHDRRSWEFHPRNDGGSLNCGGGYQTFICPVDYRVSYVAKLDEEIPNPNLREIFRTKFDILLTDRPAVLEKITPFGVQSIDLRSMVCYFKCHGQALAFSNGQIESDVAPERKEAWLSEVKELSRRKELTFDVQIDSSVFPEFNNYS